MSSKDERPSDKTHRAFETSFNKFAGRFGYEDKPVLDLNKAADYYGLMLYPGGKCLGSWALRDLFLKLEQYYGACQSPIEEMMLSALLLVGIESDHEITIISGQNRALFNSNGMNPLAVELQSGLGEYRADFLVTYEDGYGSWALRQNGSKDGPLAVSIIVECDGHDFHDRTKEQASRDRKKDRFLQSTGLPVFRYTGSDIWKDACACAHETMQRLTQMWHEKHGNAAKASSDKLLKDKGLL